MNFENQRRILFLNNNGVQCIRNGQLDDAITTLANALQDIKHNAAVEMEQGNQQQCNGECISEWFTQLFMLAKERHATSTTYTSMSGHVHQSPIELPMDDEIAMVTSVQSVAVLFNLAMAFHLLGMQQLQQQQGQQANAATTIQNAIHVYELCYEMMGSEEMNVGLYFLMCLANNLGHCHALLGDEEKAQKCFEHLLSMQMYLMDAEATSGGGENKNVGDQLVSSCEGFLQNTSHLILSDCCASAA